MFYTAISLWACGVLDCPNGRPYEYNGNSIIIYNLQDE